MAILWNAGGATVHEVVAALPRTSAYTSVLTVLRILEKKGYVQHEPHPDGGRAHVYKPLVPAGNARRQHVRDLVDRLFGGETRELVVGLLEDEKMVKGRSPADARAHRLARRRQEGKSATLKFTIGRDGKVVNGEVESTEWPALGKCRDPAMRSMAFPAPGDGIVTVVYPVLFAPG